MAGYLGEGTNGKCFVRMQLPPAECHARSVTGACRCAHRVTSRTQAICVYCVICRLKCREGAAAGSHCSSVHTSGGWHAGEHMCMLASVCAVCVRCVCGVCSLGTSTEPSWFAAGAAAGAQDSSQGDRKPSGRDQSGGRRATGRTQRDDGTYFSSSKEPANVKYPARQTVMANKQRKQPPFAFRYGTKKVIRGLEIGIKSMREGGERTIFIPSALGYGEGGSKKVPPNTDLTFVVKLITGASGLLYVSASEQACVRARASGCRLWHPTLAFSDRLFVFSICVDQVDIFLFLLINCTMNWGLCLPGVRVVYMWCIQILVGTCCSAGCPAFAWQRLLYPDRSRRPAA